MSEDFLYLPEVVPVFPLPGVVLFPRTLLPLRIFEPRYRVMTQASLAGPRILSIALLKPGFEPLYHTRRAPIHPLVGLGQIVQSEEVDDGDYNVLLRGVGRARIVQEVGEEDYRQARIEMVDTFCTADDHEQGELRTALFASVRSNPALDPDLRSGWLRLATEDLDLDIVSDVMAAQLPVEAELRQSLLGEADAFVRARSVLEHLDTLAAIARTYRRIADPDAINLN
ncbi:MAG: LON peptidase substrate-binding domain-containing protein [Phycisphaerales bacterium]|nr:LON peptidase substrate-binding domain-containing protein [Phycisphaerales bacterium]